MSILVLMISAFWPSLLAGDRTVSQEQVCAHLLQNSSGGESELERRYGVDLARPSRKISLRVQLAALEFLHHRKKRTELLDPRFAVLLDQVARGEWGAASAPASLTRLTETDFHKIFLEELPSRSILLERLEKESAAQRELAPEFLWSRDSIARLASPIVGDRKSLADRSFVRLKTPASPAETLLELSLALGVYPREKDRLMVAINTLKALGPLTWTDLFLVLQQFNSRQAQLKIVRELESNVVTPLDLYADPVRAFFVALQKDTGSVFSGQSWKQRLGSAVLGGAILTGIGIATQIDSRGQESFQYTRHAPQEDALLLLQTREVISAGWSRRHEFVAEFLSDPAWLHGYLRASRQIKDARARTEFSGLRGGALAGRLEPKQFEILLSVDLNPITRWELWAHYLNVNRSRLEPEAVRRIFCSALRDEPDWVEHERRAIYEDYILAQENRPWSDLLRLFQEAPDPELRDAALLLHFKRNGKKLAPRERSQLLEMVDDPNVRRVILRERP